MQDLGNISREQAHKNSSGTQQSQELLFVCALRPI